MKKLVFIIIIIIAVQLTVVAAYSQELLFQGDKKLAEVSFCKKPPQLKKDFSKHDIITIIIREQLTTLTDSSLDTDREVTNELSISALPIFDRDDNGLFFRTEKLQTPTIGVDTEREFEGEGEYTRAEAFSYRIAATVAAVRPNGNLLLVAKRRFRKDNEEYVVVLSGTVRPEDVCDDNSVSSDYVAELDLDYQSSGAVTDVTNRGWFTKFLDIIDPF